jgi:VanZ family protein
VAIAVAYGVLVEWRQASIPRRVASGYDVLTDAVGALGVPWALATGALVSKRAVVVFLVALAVSAAGTYL